MSTHARSPHARRRSGPALAVLVAATTTMLLAGCSTGVTVGHAQVEQQIKQRLQAKVGRPVQAAHCPGNLPGKVGATERCTITADGHRYGTTVRVTKVDGQQVSFQIRVDQHAMS